MIIKNNKELLELLDSITLSSLRGKNTEQINKAFEWARKRNYELSRLRKKRIHR